MSFTTGLYYPWIDIKDVNWLKSAVLYWDTIRTIVPESIENPYSMRTANELREAGILVPLRVHPEIEEIDSLSEDVAKYLETPEAAKYFVPGRLSSRSRVHVEKMPRDMERLSLIHPEKLPDRAREIIDRYGLIGQREGDWYNVDPGFADFYMTLLATRLSNRIGAGLLTKTPKNNRLAISAKLGASLSQSLVERRMRESDLAQNRWVVPPSLAQGMLANLTFEKIKIAPGTPISKIIRYRMDNAAALGRLRSQIGALTESISSDLPAEHLQQAVRDIYQNEVLPAMSAVKEGLSALGIKWFTDYLLKVAFLSTGPTALSVSLGLSIPQALLAGAGVSLTASIILYNVDRRQSLQDNPYAYVLAANRAFK